MFQFVRDWSKRHEARQQLLDALNLVRGPGSGLDIPLGNNVAEVALQDLLKNRPDLVVLKFKKNRTLMYRADANATVSTGLVAKCESDGFFAQAGETLVFESERDDENDRG